MAVWFKFFFIRYTLSAVSYLLANYLLSVLTLHFHSLFVSRWRGSDGVIIPSLSKQQSFMHQHSLAPSSEAPRQSLGDSISPKVYGAYEVHRDAISNLVGVILPNRLLFSLSPLPRCISLAAVIHALRLVCRPVRWVMWRRSAACELWLESVGNTRPQFTLTGLSCLLRFPFPGP